MDYHPREVGGGQKSAKAGSDANRSPIRLQTGWSPTCDHGSNPVPCVCLDPFSGAGTVGLVAQRLQRDAVLIELSTEYAEMARDRIVQEMPLFAQVRMLRP